LFFHARARGGEAVRGADGDAVNIYAADNVNPNESGNPRPVVVRLYQLKNDVRLQNATLRRRPPQGQRDLADDILKVDEVTVFPNDLVEVKFERIKEATPPRRRRPLPQPRKATSWKTFYEFPLAPGEVACGGRETEAGAPRARPQGGLLPRGLEDRQREQFDESMFEGATSVRKINLPKKSASPEARGCRCSPPSEDPMTASPAAGKPTFW
jgi:type VI secretion system protein VasD